MAALIELGAGFHPEISGRENVFINGAVLGLSRREIEKRYDRIVSFAGLEEFMEEPVKNYSSGMYVRLGFSVAVHTDPEILLVDEVLSVGDESFSHRCMRRIEEFLAGGGTLLLVSHDLGLVEEICDRALWLDRGHLRLEGAPRRVNDAYRQAIAEQESSEHQIAKDAEEQVRRETGDDSQRWGSGQAEIVAARLLDGDGQETYHLESGAPASFEIEVRAHEELSDFVFGVKLSTPRGVECWGTNTDLDGWQPEQLVGGATIRLGCPDLRLGPGEYLVDVAVHSREGAPYDYRRRLFAFSVTASRSRCRNLLPRAPMGLRGRSALPLHLNLREDLHG